MTAGANPLLADDTGHMPIHLYADSGRMRLVAALVTRWRVPVDARTYKNETSLHITRDYSSVRALLDLGAEPSAVDCHGRTPLDFALHRPLVDHRVLNALVRAGGYWRRSPFVVRDSLIHLEHPTRKHTHIHRTLRRHCIHHS